MQFSPQVEARYLTEVVTQGSLNKFGVVARREERQRRIAIRKVHRVKKGVERNSIGRGLSSTSGAIIGRIVVDFEEARRLNDDRVSKDIVTNILSGKDFYQANLDISKWKKGEVYFKLLHSGKASVSFIGSKAAINDIDAKQGLVNYELKYT
jgi:hypothetical protein